VRRLTVPCGLLLLLSGCSSSSSPGPVGNVQPIVVNAGPTHDYFNGIFTDVIVCEPGNAAVCQTITDILVDTGSTGLRILSSALTLTLPQQAAANGSAIAECAQFKDGYTWGPVQTADIKLASEQASAVPIQVIGPPAFAAVPTGCSSAGLVAEDTLATLGANGILGIGLFRQDCGIACSFAGSSNPGLYYSCPASGCVPTTESLTQQLQNPVWMFAHDSNGVVINLPTVPPTGLLAVSGSLVFGIGTESNNSLGAAKVLTTGADGTIVAVFNGQSYPGSFIDSGSNGLYFLDAATSGLALCSDAKSFYCPSVSQTLSATNRGANGVVAPITFTVASADSLSSLFSAFSTIAGPNPGAFDWGVPFFYGRLVFTAIEGQITPAGVGPYWAY
jgi:uncharacterized protein DUF3443